MCSKIIQDSWLEVISSRKVDLLVNIKKELDFLEKEDINVDFNIKNLDYFVRQSEYIKLKERYSDKNFIDRIENSIEKIPKSNGTEYFNEINVRIGLIADEFLFNSFKDVAKVIYVDRNSYSTLELDVLVIATSWKGINENWRGMGNPNNSKIREELDNIIYYFRSQGAKIVFYSKEDPTNYHNFIDIAKKCDYIFTTAIEKINDYKNDCNNDNVYVLEFGVNPIYNNPIGISANNEKLEGAIFAGSWYEKYPNRMRDTRLIFDGIISANHDLKIIDRNFNKNLPNHLFPYQYLKYISPSIDHSILQKVFKLYPWTINLNSVQTSETMFANRVYELQAMGNLILSNYSVGINNLFPNVFMVQNSSEVKGIMNNSKNKELYSHQMYGVRKVLKQHTTFHRVNTLLEKIGYGKDFIPKKVVAVVVEDISDSNNAENFERQTFEHRQLITVEQLQENYHSFDYVTFFNNEYEYGEYYLEDMINAFKYTASSYVTKDSFYDGDDKVLGVEHDYVNRIRDKYKTVFSTGSFLAKELTKIVRDFECNNGYSIDCLELNTDPKNVSEEVIELKLSVIVPVYNNGEHLYGKCFQSLLRSSMFEQMDIILVDDGSTDKTTINMVDRLNRLYPNVQLYKFNDGGSGSASRPRNKGVHLAKTDYITYLDPDNEAINDGYYRMFNEMQKDEELDLVVGDIVKIDFDEKKLNYSHYVLNKNPLGVITNTSEFLKDSNLRVQSIQALIVKKEIILKNNLQMIEKAAGQDSLFFQELLLNCEKIKAIDLDIHIYYAAVSNSVTNTISKKFFDKYLVLEKERYVFLNKNGLFKHYISDRFSDYFIRWYLFRVPKIREGEEKDSLKTLYQIYEIYQSELQKKAEPIEFFERCMHNEDYLGFINYCKSYFEAGDNH
ncbi:glycosyltransferase [Pseudogracilibacillus auburnensis]|uniref:Glycosyl transferase family 2 n=1 Tax=Pseudogracilibacillus auburnensis TaxID=1494959 RepID=A0A2V3VV70_9BACI|nr:glycosyltransferase [Pseudogracilibacillus auburnensis]PXW85863.1 glycosyl transferase family 2 [Pseudogracilibacillus auburnensis]